MNAEIDPHDDDFIFTIIQMISVFGTLINLLGLYVVLYGSTKEMKEYARGLTFLQITSTICDHITANGSSFYFLLPMPAGIPKGWMRWLSISTETQLALTIAFLGHTQTCSIILFFIRFQTILPIGHDLKMSVKNRYLVYMIFHILPHIFFIGVTRFSFPTQDLLPTNLYFLQKYPSLTRFINDTNFLAIPRNIVPFSVISMMAFFGGCIALMTFFAFLSYHFLNAQEKVLSTKLIQERKLWKLLIIQVLIPMITIVIPIQIGSCIVLWLDDVKFIKYCPLLTLLAAQHGVTNSIATLILYKPYRYFIKTLYQKFRYFILSHVFGFTVNIFGLYIVFRYSPKAMKEYSHGLMFLQIVTTICDHLMADAALPFLIFPVFAGIPMGYFNYFDVPTDLQGALCMSLIGHTQSCTIVLFFQRLEFILPKSDFFNFPNKIRYFLVFSAQISPYIYTMILFKFVAPNPDLFATKEYYIQTYPELILFIQSDRFYGFPPNTIQPAIINILGFLGFSFVIMNAIAIYSFRSLKLQEKNLSQRLIASQRKLLKALIIQVLIPMITIVIPYYIGFLAVFYKSTAYTKFCPLITFFVAQHGLANTIGTLILYTPYRENSKRIIFDFLTCYKTRKSVTKPITNHPSVAPTHFRSRSAADQQPNSSRSMRSPLQN